MADELIEFHSKNCSRLVYGKCSTRRCLIRGGWNKGGSAYERATYPLPADLYEKATCEYYETVQLLSKLRATPQTEESR